MKFSQHFDFADFAIFKIKKKKTIKCCDKILFVNILETSKMLKNDGVDLTSLPSQKIGVYLKIHDGNGSQFMHERGPSIEI